MRWAKLGDVPSQSELNDIVAETARDRVLADDELRRVLTADVDELTRDLVWGLLLSCQRRGDLGAMQIEDVGDGGIWRFVVQKSRSREKVSHPLSQSMLELVARRAAGRSAGLVFASRAYAPAPPSNWSHRLTRLHRASQTANWAWHDLRRSGRSLLSRVGTPLEVAEKIMNHSVPGIVRIYDRYGFEAEMHAAYERLANALQGIAEGRVTVLDRRRRGSSDEAS
jgi:integrase